VKMNKREVTETVLLCLDRLAERVLDGGALRDEELAELCTRAGPEHVQFMDAYFEARLKSAPLEWVGSICEIVSDVDRSTPGVYSVGDREPCCLCDSPVEKSCTASVRRRCT